MKKSHFLKGCLIAILFCAVCAGGLYAWAVVSSWLPIDQTAPDLALPGPFTQTMLELAPASIQNAMELLNIQSSSKPDEIVALHQSMEDLDLLVVHESGIFHRWDLETQALEAEYDFRVGRRTGVSFNADGSRVVTPGKLVSDDLLYGYSVWDTSTGEMFACWGDHCPDPRPFNKSLTDTGIVLSLNGNWIVKYSWDSLTGDALQENVIGPGYIYVDSNYRDYKSYTIEQIAFDRSGVYLAVAIKQGVLRVYDCEYEFLSIADKRTLIEEGEIPGKIYSDGGIMLRSRDRQYGRYDNENPIRTADLAIDDTRTWLARLTDEELIIYDLRRMIFPRHLKIPISNGNLLAFNHSGNLLAVATDDEILMLNIAKRKQVASFQTNKATALFFTHDDRLLTWGDKDGVIYIWGVEE